jgi:hypothetical protein
MGNGNGNGSIVFAVQLGIRAFDGLAIPGAGTGRAHPLPFLFPVPEGRISSVNAPADTPIREAARPRDRTERKERLRSLRAHCRERREQEFAARYATA